MLEFGNLEVVERTFTRANVSPRGQAFDGIKFRRFESTKGKKAAEKNGIDFTPFIETQFVISDKAYELMGLDENALTEAKSDGKVLLMVVEDQDKLKPVAKFLRQSYKEGGAKSKKGKFFSNPIMEEHLTEVGVLGTEVGNQYLKLTPVEVSGAPSHVKAVYQLEVDSSVDASADTNDDSQSEDSERDF